MTREVTPPRRGRIATALACIAAVSACRDAPPRAPMIAVRTAVPAPAPTRPPRRPEAWTQALSLRAGVDDFSPRANVLAGGVEVAANDDALPGRGSRVTLTATRATRYEVRVTAHGPWAREGPYTLTVRREPRADAGR